MRYGLVEGKVALVTGAGSGIGRASALKFTREGARVVIADYNEEGGGETLQMVKEAGGEGLFVRADVSSKDDVEAMVRKTIEAYGRLDCAYNNAGIPGTHSLLAKASEEDWDRIISINLKSVWNCMRAEIAQMLSRGGGAIVNTASAVGLGGIRSDCIYVASKHGVVGLTRAVALDYAARGIRVNCVCPGFTSTPTMAPLMVSERLMAAMASIQPPNRLAEPDEVANAVVWLCSDEASFVNGHALSVDGGMSIEIMKWPHEITDMIS